MTTKAPVTKFSPDSKRWDYKLCDDGNFKLGRMVLSRFRKAKRTFKHITLGTRDNEDSHVMDREVFRKPETEGLTFQWPFGMI